MKLNRGWVGFFRKLRFDEILLLFFLSFSLKFVENKGNTHFPVENRRERDLRAAEEQPEEEGQRREGLHRDGRLRGEQRVGVSEIDQRIRVCQQQVEQPQVGPGRGDDSRGGGGGERGDEQDHSILNEEENFFGLIARLT